MTRCKQFCQSRAVRLAVLGVLILASIGLLLSVLRNIPQRLYALGTNDLTAYYSAARLLVNQQNPYDASLLLEIERVVDWAGNEALMIYNPPWTLCLMLPLLLFPFKTAAFLWLVTNILLAVACGAAIWLVLTAGSDRRVWLGYVISVMFAPVFVAVRIGQISLWLLLGVTLFLVGVRGRYDYLAGAALALLTIKPHVTYLLFLAVACWVLRERRWKVVAGGALALALGCGIVVYMSPQVFAQYLRASSSPPVHFRFATLGTWLRTFIKWDWEWLQYIPSLLGAAGFVFWALRVRGSWRWESLLPVLLLASTVTAAYGWGFDQVTLLPVVIALLVSVRLLPYEHRFFLICIYALMQALLLVQAMFKMDMSLYYWHPLTLTGLYIWQAKQQKRSVALNNPQAGVR